MCLSVRTIREDISRTTCAIFTKYFVHVAYRRDSVLLRRGDKTSALTKSQGEDALLGVFFPTDNALYSVAFWTSKNGCTDRDAVWDEWAWTEKCVAWGLRSPKGKGSFGGKPVPDKPNTHNICQLDWSIQRHTTEADA